MAGRQKWSNTRQMVRGWLGPPVLKTAAWVACRSSWAGAQSLARRIGRLAFRLSPRHRSNTIKHIRLAFADELPEPGPEQLARDCFQHMFMLALETLRMTGMSGEDLAEVACIEGLEHLQDAVAAGRGGVIFGGHFGNWQIAAVRGRHEGLPLIAWARERSNPRLDRAFVALQQRLDIPMIQAREGARGILRALHDNHLVAILADRFARGGGVTVPFFGRETHVWHTPALMAQRAGCPIIPVHGVRRPDGTYLIEVDPPIELQDTGDRAFDAWVATARTMALLEEKLRRHPEQYLWPYALWRPAITPPPPYPFEMLPELSVSTCTQRQS